MQPLGLPFDSLAIEPAIDPHILTVTPDTPLVDVLALMSQVRSSCALPDVELGTDEGKTNPDFNLQLSQFDSGDTDTAGSCVLVMDDSNLVGVFTERDIVKLTANQTSLNDLKIGEVVAPQVVTIRQSAAQDVFTALSLFRQHRIRHVPVLDDQGQVVGLITHESIRKALQPVNLLTRLRDVADVMSTQIVHAPLTASVLHLAQLMAQHRVSCVVITQEGTSQPLAEAEPAKPILSTENTFTQLLIPVGIVTERDIVQFQSLALDLSRMQAQDAMSTPLFCLRPMNSLWFAHQEMQRRHVRRLVVTGSQGELLGIVSQTSLLQVLNPADMYEVIEVLQQAVEERTKELEDSNKLLRHEILERTRAERALLKAHDDLKRQVEERTADLAKANTLLKKDILERVAAEAAVRQSEAQLRQQATQLEQTLQELQKTQFQLIQTEKMSSLGQLVAGVAHEINNPVNFIYGNLTHANEYMQDLLRLLEMYQQHYPNPHPEIQEEAEAVDLEFLMQDLPKLLSSMKVGADRIQKIVLALRNFSRMDEADVKEINIHEGIDSTLMILHNRMKDKPEHRGIEVIKEYGTLPLVECYAGQLNQVFMNVISNAIDALDERDSQRSPQEIKNHPSSITIRTQALNPQQVQIRIADNGSGMPENVRRRLFEPFFTTKSRGTGLGLSIVKQIINYHHGDIKVWSNVGVGTKFTITLPQIEEL